MIAPDGREGQFGGPLDATFEPGNFRRLMFGMSDILGNAYGFTASPTEAQLLEASRPFMRGNLLGQDRNTPMLIVNGADDVHVPQQDTLVFDGRRDTEVHLVPGTGHVAASKLPEVMPVITRWLRTHLAE